MAIRLCGHPKPKPARNVICNTSDFQGVAQSQPFTIFLFFFLAKILPTYLHVVTVGDIIVFYCLPAMKLLLKDWENRQKDIVIEARVEHGK